MNRRNLIRAILFLGVAALLPPHTALAQSDAAKRKPDLADAAEGKYFGDVISDSKGSSKNEVTLTVTRIGVNKVRVSSDYARLPTVEVALTKALNKILQARGNTVFLLDRSANPAKLDVSFLNEVSWAGTKQ
jgi:hypothetical protein